MVVQPMIYARSLARPANDKRHIAGEFIRRLMISPDIQLTQIFAMIGSNHNDRIVVKTMLLQRRDQMADVLVCVANTGIITVEPGRNFLHRIIGAGILV